MDIKKIKRIKLFLLAIIILCNLGTLFFVAPLKENLSYLGNELGHKIYFIFWGCSTGIYFLYYTYRFMKRYGYPNKIGILFLFLACLGMVASVFLPYDPVSFPEVSKWHIRIAMWSTGLYVLIFFHFLFHLMKKDFLLFEKSLSSYSVLVAFDLLLFILYGSVSTLLEITFTIGMAIISYWMDFEYQ